MARDLGGKAFVIIKSLVRGESDLTVKNIANFFHFLCFIHPYSLRTHARARVLKIFFFVSC